MPRPPVRAATTRRSSRAPRKPSATCPVPPSSSPRSSVCSADLPRLESGSAIRGSDDAKDALGGVLLGQFGDCAEQGVEVDRLRQVAADLEVGGGGGGVGGVGGAGDTGGGFD